MDKRIIRSKAAMRQALFSLMKEMPVKSIQITEICKRAGLDRTTFYKHYKCVDDMLDELAAEQQEKFSKLLREKTKYGADALRDILVSVDIAKDLFRVREGGQISDRFKTGLVETAMENGLPGWLEITPGADPESAAMAYEAILAGALHIALSSSAEDREKVVDTIMDLICTYINTHS